MMNPDDIDFYERLLSGQCHAVGWGVCPSFYFQRWQEQFPIKLFTETKYMMWDTTIAGQPVVNPMELRDLDARTHAVINYFKADWVQHYTKRISKLPVVTPYPIQTVLRGLATKGQKQKKRITPLSLTKVKQIQNELTELADAPTLNGEAVYGDKVLKNRDLLASYDWTHYVAAILKQRKIEKIQEKTIIVAGNSLCYGGAERQLVNLALGLKNKDWNVHSVSISSAEHAPPYLYLMQSNDIPVHRTTEGVMLFPDEAFTRKLLDEMPADIRLALWHMPFDFSMNIALAIRKIRQIKPRVVIAYLDWGSVVMGLAAVLCGVPHVIVSGRNYGPLHFPHFFNQVIPAIHDLYQLLRLCPNVTFTNNSRLGAQDYAKWLGMPQSDITYIPNCLANEFFATPKAAAVNSVRRNLGLKPRDKIVLGVFRLAPEKRPEKFLAIIHKLITKMPEIKAFICGDGLSRAATEKEIKRLGLENHVTLLGEFQNVRAMMALADILLHTSSHEGMPNVLLEAQSQGLPIVCTKSGGVDDCLAKAMLPYTFHTNDWTGVEQAALKLLRDGKLRKRLGEAEKKHARKEFTVDRLVTRNLALTRQAKQKTS